MFDPTKDSHRRFNPLTNSWVLCSPHRAQRPWQGAQEDISIDILPQYDSKCYLCPGNPRANGEINIKYESTFIFDNDYSAVKPDQVKYDILSPHPLLKIAPTRGRCCVICFSPRHDLTLAQMNVDNIIHVINSWKQVYKDFSNQDFISHIQIFENKGSQMGCSNPHPHGQIWATEHIPEESNKELKNLEKYKSQNGECLLCSYIQIEIQNRSRIICENDSFICLVPFWAIWPFETIIIVKNHIQHILQLNQKQTFDFSDIIQRITCRYDNLFKCSFPYSMGLHQKPTLKSTNIHQHLHLHFYPPLLRSSTIRKFLVGYELMGEPQRDITPEQAAAQLRNLSEVHYLNTKE